MPHLVDFYKAQINKHKDVIRQKGESLKWNALFRLIDFLAIAYVFYQLVSKPSAVFYFLLFILIVLFILLVKRSVRIREDKNFEQEMLFVCSNELGVLEGRKNQFPNGEEFTGSCSYSEDLDIFGEGSLFQLVNRTTTSHGRKNLAKLLSSPFLDAESILNFQNAIRELSAQPENCLRITATGLVDRETEGNLTDVEAWLQIPSKIKDKGWVSIARYVFPLLSIGALLYYLSTDNYIPLLLAVVIAWIITGIFKKYIEEQHRLLGKKNEILQQYARILQKFTAVDPGDSELIKEQKIVASETHEAIFRLSKLTGLFDQRYNLLVNFFMNSFLLYDIQCTNALEKWKSQHARQFPRWISCVSVIETLTSLSAFARNNPTYSFPEISGKPALLQVSKMGHPLISPAEMITNDLVPGSAEKVLLITGSNMAGKTTFLRSAGINLILAQCGAPVCAEYFLFSPMQLLTSIRINDSLLEHTSYFMAELIRLKYISDQLKGGIPALILVDEILRGTNSDDKTFGSRAFITSMLPYDCLALFATHDLSLSGLENEYPDVISNYSFESIIENDDLSFDYKLRKGIAKHKNASFLMKKMGIIQ